MRSVAGGDRADQRLGARARQHRAAVVLGHPVAVIAQLVGQPREVERVGSACGPVAPSEIGDWSRTDTSMAFMVEGPFMATSTALRDVTATRYVTPLREGGSLPGLVEADDDGLYVAKFRGAGQGPRALVAELVAASWRARSACTCPSSCGRARPGARRAPSPIPEIQDLITASAGSNLGVDFLPGSLPYVAGAARGAVAGAGRRHRLARRAHAPTSTARRATRTCCSGTSACG